MYNRLLVRIDGGQNQSPEENVKVIFGPHHFVDIIKNNGGVKFVLGVTHHAVMLDASDTDSELEQLVWKLRKKNPKKSVESNLRFKKKRTGNKQQKG